MGLIKKISSLKYERRKRKEEKELEKFNQRQEELDAKYRKEKQKRDFKSLLANLKFETYTKRLVGIVVFVSLVDLQLSYVLAFLDKVQIAESLSNQICVTLLGTILVYVVRAHFDTKAEKRDEMIKAGYIIAKDSSVVPTEAIRSKVEEIINNSGLGGHVSTDDIITPETENPDDFICGGGN